MPARKVKKNPAAKKPAAKKTTAKKPAAKKTTAKKPAAKKTAAKKTAAKKPAATTAAVTRPARAAPPPPSDLGSLPSLTLAPPPPRRGAADPTAATALLDRGQLAALLQGGAVAPPPAAPRAPTSRQAAPTVLLDTTVLKALAVDDGDEPIIVDHRDDATAHPITAEQMAEVRRTGLRGDDEILHVEDDAGVVPCRLVEHGDGRFSLCLDDFKMPDVPAFTERGLQGNGYTWEAVVDALIRRHRPHLEPEVDYDSEAGMFVALGGRGPLLAVAALLQRALSEPHVLEDALQHADPDRLE